ncbi:MAG: copper chaperone PCu(A)C [Sphingomonadales bacterium]|jgi:copper(I)-binding protein
MTMKPLLALLALLAAPLPAQAAGAGPLVIDHPVLRVASPVSKTGAGYMVIRNTGRVADTLVSVTTAAANRSDLHGSVESGGVVRMISQASGVPIPAGGRAVFAPGGLHVMFIGIRKPVPVGTKVPARLIFARAGAIDVLFTAEGFSPAGG